MSNNSPNSLVITNKPEAKLISKKHLFVVSVIVSCLLLFVAFNMFYQEEKATDDPKMKEIKVNENNIDFAPKTNVKSGLLIPPKPKEEPKKEFFPEIQISRTPEPSESVKRIIQMREQAYLAALNASTTAYTGKKESSAQPNEQQNIVQVSAAERPLSNMATSLGGKNSYDVSSDIDKEQFFERSKPDNQWINPDIRTAGQKYEIKTGSVIPAAMITAVNSDLPGNIIAQVTQNIYDSATGHYLLIPQGSKLFGVYDSRVIMGQQRVLVAWNRIIFPDGSAMTIPSIPGADMAGNSGFSQNVNNHYFRIFGSSILMALITAGTAYAVDQNSGSDNENSLQAQMNSALAQQFGQVTTSLLEKNLNIKPTLEIDPGYQFNIVLTKDLVFGESYKRWR